MSERIIIVGAGLAGHRAAHTLRKGGFAGELIVLGEEPHAPYDRPPLSKAFLAGELEAHQLTLPGPAIECDWRLGVAAVGLDLGAGEVHTTGGPLGYDHLILATGRRARPFPGLDGAGHVLRSLDDARALAAAVTRQSRVLIVGAGFIGCEVAATLRGLAVASVTVCDIAPLPLAPAGPELGVRTAAVHRAHGVDLHLGTGVADVEQADGRISAVTLGDGTRLEVDVVLFALGSLPNTEWLEGAGLVLERGAVRVDETLVAEGTENVLVAGDIAAFPFPEAGHVAIEHWSTARETGALAAQNALAAPGERSAYRPVPTFWSDQYNLKIKSCGLLSLAETWTVVEDDMDAEKPGLVVEAHRAGRLIGAVGINRPRPLIAYQQELEAERAPTTT